MSKKSAKGSVGIESFQGRLRLRFPRHIFNGKQKYLALGLSDTPKNYKAAEIKANQVELDIISNNFDPTLEKYKPKKHITSDVKAKAASQLNLLELWDKYTDYRKPQIAETTLKIQYQAVRNHILKLPSKSIDDALDIRSFLVQHLSNDSARRTLTQISACCEWACEESLIENNPFRGMAKRIKVVKDNTESIDPFTLEEKEAIIQAFEKHSVHSYYAPFVKFLFMTGCRTGEAIGLKWKHISPDCKTIHFCESISTQLKIAKDCKTHKSRFFPCNSSLQKLLLSIKPADCKPEMLVFPSRRGGVLSSKTFLENAWKGRPDREGSGLVTELVLQGKVQRYRTQYNTRHTFITHCLEAGVSVVQVAKWVGNSPEIIMKHYAGTIKQVQVPEF